MVKPLLLALAVAAACLAGDARPRLLVLTDIGGDPDDQQAMVRLMVFSNEFEIAGLVASASGTPGELKRDIVQPQLIREIVEAYGRVRPNLARHAAGYPAAEALLPVIQSGSPNRGVANLGEGRDTEGSRWIVSAADSPDPRPLNIAIWGGAHDLAQALWRVRNDRTPAETARFVAKLRVHSIGHQDDTGPWIVENFPGLFFVLSLADPGDVLGSRNGKVDRRLSAYRGMYLGGDESLTSREWIDRNVRTGHGPLGALYPPKTWTAPNPHGALKEGDTPSWFYFLPDGLGDPAHPEWGGWGGRFRRVRGRYYNDAEDRLGEVRDARATVWRWREAFQNDFAARMDWCVKPYSEANHPPVVKVNHAEQFSVKSGQYFRLDADGTTDPDGDSLSYFWFQYPEIGTYKEVVSFGPFAPNLYNVHTIRAPEVTSPQTVHFILKVTDKGTPPLTRYKRVIVTIEP